MSFDASSLEDEYFFRIAEKIKQYSGLSITMNELMKQRIKCRALELGLNDLRHYYYLLCDEDPLRLELRVACDILSTHETYFFRDLLQLRAFQEVLGEIKECNSDRRTLNIWSAGCSTGEEAYTVGILIHASCLFQGWSVSILGTDVSATVLQAAKAAVYAESSFRTDDSRYEAYFVDTQAGKCVSPEIVAMCSFEAHNLLDNPPVLASSVDVVFCRNVLIYFEDKVRHRVLDYFYQALRTGGYLFLGHSESLLNLDTRFEVIHRDGKFIYYKPPLLGGNDA